MGVICERAKRGSHLAQSGRRQESLCGTARRHSHRARERERGGGQPRLVAVGSERKLERESKERETTSHSDSKVVFFYEILTCSLLSVQPARPAIWNLWLRAQYPLMTSLSHPLPLFLFFFFCLSGISDFLNIGTYIINCKCYFDTSPRRSRWLHGVIETFSLMKENVSLEFELSRCSLID